ncbi:class I SAM-dependent methyltransferase [Wenzhouxiangella sp. AB-CW3]|uniref:class I SAM-dependent methyltransferase n=1 Tax=Wenzhouxiangella sp. AB-CW3 TaxID=2771012 RepID=UPI00168A91AF|nr:class I SAM-dependent methyltransferase [Wenzhouxiangella sp. AB-CW3]QOC22925.1 class I SAM-dependent methyltransferase [Wenzhouxiangella sp. AB-CW3]
MDNNWYLDEEFWRTFGPLMFNADTFARGEEEIECLLSLLDMPPVPTLDLGAGPGRHSLPLARSGYPVTALDTSAYLLDQLGESASDLPVEIMRADMREFVREQAFGLVLVMWTSFGYFENEADHARVLENMSASLRPGGRLVLDLVGLETLCRTMEPVHLTEYDDGRLLVERPALIDHMTRLDNEWLLIDGDTIHRTHFSHRVWSAGEISSLLNSHGFDILAIHGDYQGADYDLEAERMIVIAQPIEST